MKKIFGCLLTIAILAACTPAERVMVAKGALDVVSVGCVLAKADLPNATEIAVACGIASTLIPDIEKIVDEFKMQRTAYASAHKVCK